MSNLEPTIRGFLGALRLREKVTIYFHNSKNTNLLAQHLPEIMENTIEKPDSFCSSLLDNIFYQLNQNEIVQWAYGGNHVTSHYLFLNMNESDAAVYIGLSDINLSTQLADAYIKANS